jgi:hypothetical protein
MKILEDLEPKEKKIYIWIAVAILVVGATGFLVWRVNQKAKLSSEESEASGTVACGSGCVNDSDCIGWDGGSGDVECNQGSTHKCEVYRCPDGYIIGPRKCSCIPPDGIACGDYGCYSDGDCEGGTGPNQTHECAQIASGDISKQQCERIACPTGYEVGDDKCSCVLSVANTCEGGGWTRKPTSFNEDETFTIAGYGEDSDGISTGSIEIKLDGSTIAGYKITKETNGNRVDWSTTLSDLDAGSHTVVVTWEDSEGKGGDDCTLSTTFSVLGVSDDEEEEEEEGDTTTPTVDEPDSTPQTGILDEAWGKVALGFGILGVGMVIRKFNFLEFSWNGVQVERSTSTKKKKGEKYSNNFEKKVVKGN